MSSSADASLDQREPATEAVRLERLGYDCAERRRWTQAAELLEEARRLGRDSDSLLWVLGWSHYRLGRLAECLASWKEFQQRHPAHAALSARLVEVNYLLGLKAAVARDWPTAIAAWTECLQEPALAELAGRNLAEAHFRCASRLLRDHAQDGLRPADDHLAAAQALCPQDARLTHYRGLLAARLPAPAAVEAQDLSRAAAAHARRSEWREAAEALARLFGLDPELHRRLEEDSRLAAAVATLYTLAGRRDQAIQVSQRLQSASISDFRAAHLLAVCHYWGAVHELAEGRKGEAARAWQQVIANAVLLLHLDGFWQQWCSRREGAYQAAIDSQGVSDFRRHVEQRLLDRLTLASPEGIDLRVELGGARALEALGGIPSPDGSQRVVCGPRMLGQLRYTQPFSRFLRQQVLASEPNSEQAAALGQVMRCFSRLGEAQAWLDYGRPAEALHALERACCERCAQHWRREAAGQAWLPRVCRGDCHLFGFLNPAFAELPEREARLRQEAAQLAAEAHLAVADGRNLLPTEAAAAWREALRLAGLAGSEGRLESALAERAIARAAALTEEARLDEAVELLESAHSLCREPCRDELRGALARALHTRAVNRAGSAQPDWEAVVKDCRRAVELNPHVFPVWCNLAVALQNMAAEWFLEDHRRAATLLGEATQALANARERFPGRDELDERQSQLDRQVGVLASMIERALRESPDDPELLQAKGMLGGRQAGL